MPNKTAIINTSIYLIVKCLLLLLIYIFFIFHTHYKNQNTMNKEIMITLTISHQSVIGLGTALNLCFSFPVFFVSYQKENAQNAKVVYHNNDRSINNISTTMIE